MATRFFANTYVKAQATATQADLALAVIKLFQSTFTPTPDSLIADYDTAEANYTTYAPETITVWLDPVTAAVGGYRITAPTEQFDLAATPAVGNLIGGYWIENAAGDVVIVTVFDAPVPMQVAGDFIQVNPTITFPNGS